MSRGSETCDRYQSGALIERAGILLRRIHADTWPWFGDLLQEAAEQLTAMDIATTRQLRRGGSTDRQAGRPMWPTESPSSSRTGTRR